MANPATTRSKPAKLVSAGNRSITSRRTLRGIWELARLHEPLLTFLAWYPTVWTQCLFYRNFQTSVAAPKLFQLALNNYIIVALTHSACCTLNDIFDRKFDALVPRTASRPLPSGMISLRGAVISYLCWALVTISATWYLQGSLYLLLWFPSWVLSSLYPLTKRWIDFPQLVLSSAVACVLLPSWINSGGTARGIQELIPIVCFIFCWITYIDMFYATMDSAHDTAAGVKSLTVALLPRIHLFLSLLATGQVLCLSILAWRSQKSILFWILGVGVWAANNIWHIRGLRIIDGNWSAGSGGVIFKRNIGLGAWLCVAEVLELWVQGALVF